MRKTPEEAAYDAYLEAMDLNEGDMVEIIGMTDSFFMGWNNTWDQPMEEDGIYYVAEIRPNRAGIRLDTKLRYGYPPYSLRKLSPEEVAKHNAKNGTGWKCPCCGRCNSPAIKTCPCYED